MRADICCFHWQRDGLGRGGRICWICGLLDCSVFLMKLIGRDGFVVGGEGWGGRVVSNIGFGMR